MSDTEFADLTLNAAKSTQDGPLRTNKDIIPQAGTTLKNHPHDITLHDIKKRLITANRMRKLDLSRADLAYALNQKDVLSSEIKHANSSFHFIRLD